MIELDKLLHLYACAILILGITFCTQKLILGILITLLIALGKEFYDGYFGTEFDLVDIVFDIFGIIIGVLIIDFFK